MVVTFEDASKGVMDHTAALDVRIRSLYDLKAHRVERPAEVAQVLLQAVDTTTSVLLQHEFLYNVGQIGLPETIPQLEAIVLNHSQYDVVSRHEAIESMGAIGLTSVKAKKLGAEGEKDATTESDALDFLIMVQEDPKSEQPIIESCVLAVERIKRISAEGAAEFMVAADAEFVSIDPTPASKEVKELSKAVQLQRFQGTQGKVTPEAKTILDEKLSKMCVKLGDILKDESATLWDRYQAMFGLRDIGTDEAVAQLCVSLRQDKSSCLFRHEVAFVLGQLENATSSATLIESLRDEKEHAMVRHEAAEALGSVANKSDWDVLTEYAQHPEALVKDSCVVALDMHTYWTNFHAGANDSEKKSEKQ